MELKDADRKVSMTVEVAMMMENWTKWTIESWTGHVSALVRQGTLEGAVKDVDLLRYYQAIQGFLIFLVNGDL